MVMVYVSVLIFLTGLTILAICTMCHDSFMKIEDNIYKCTVSKIFMTREMAMYHYDLCKPKNKIEKKK